MYMVSSLAIHLCSSAFKITDNVSSLFFCFVTAVCKHKPYPIQNLKEPRNCLNCGSVIIMPKIIKTAVLFFPGSTAVIFNTYLLQIYLHIIVDDISLDRFRYPVV